MDRKQAALCLNESILHHSKGVITAWDGHITTGTRPIRLYLFTRHSTRPTYDGLIPPELWEPQALELEAVRILKEIGEYNPDKAS